MTGEEGKWMEQREGRGETEGIKGTGKTGRHTPSIIHKKVWKHGVNRPSWRKERLSGVMIEEEEEGWNWDK